MTLREREGEAEGGLGAHKDANLKPEPLDVPMAQLGWAHLGTVHSHRVIVLGAESVSITRTHLHSDEIRRTHSQADASRRKQPQAGASRRNQDASRRTQHTWAPRSTWPCSSESSRVRSRVAMAIGGKRSSHAAAVATAACSTSARRRSEPAMSVCLTS